ncbi:MAG: DUF4403 family protein [Chlorobiaceae bacterium]|nr:DUF4403 family protein [Chlorobiaceae bacterium]
MKKALLITTLLLGLLASGLYYLLRKNSVVPPAAINEKIIIDIPQSTFNIPIIIEVKSLADYLNQKITGKFLETTLFLQESEKEQILLTLTKAGSITITSTGRELLCTLPLTVDATLLDSRFGKTLSGLVSPFHTGIILTLSTPIDLDRNWRLKTKFTIREHQWLSEPVIKLGPFKKNIRKQLDDAISLNSNSLTSMVDQEINKAASLRKTVAHVWHDLQKPIRITSYPAPVWIRFNCSDISGNIKLQKSAIVCFASVKAKMLLVTDTTAQRAHLRLPDYRELATREKQPESDLFIYASTSFDEINQQLNKMLHGTEILSKGYRIAILDIRAYTSTEGLTVAVDTGGDLDGRFYLTGRPVFDIPTQRLKVQNFDFTVNSGSLLVERGDEVLHNLLRERIASKLNLGLDTLIMKLPALINHAIAKGKTGRTIDLRVENLAIKQCDILMGKEMIHFIINAQTETTIRLKKIKAGRPIRIH